MIARIGIELTADVVRGVAMRNGAVIWRDAVALGRDDNLGDNLTALLARFGETRGSVVVAVLAAPHGRTKVLHGLDDVARADLATEAARTNAERYFVVPAGGVEVSRAVRENGAWRATAYVRSAIAAVEDGCAASSAELRWIAPAKTNATALGERPDEFAGAIDAARTRRPTAMCVPSQATGRRHASAQHRRRVALATIAALSFVAALASPTVSAERMRRRAVAALNNERNTLPEVAASLAELTRVSGHLNTVNAFASSRRSMLHYLASIARALPESSAIVTLRADSVAATLVLITRAGPGILQRLANIDAVSAPQVLGPFARENVGGATFERVATRSTFVAPRPAPAGAIR
ncbi:MAG TPA: hypothetical protein VJR92_01330 [Gemmatimonadaceae bacterium]|nr:hypothetical protein [Gemmatimonadaceae bacterium]